MRSFRFSVAQATMRLFGFSVTQTTMPSYILYKLNQRSYLPALSKDRAPHPDTPNLNKIFQKSRF